MRLHIIIGKKETVVKRNELTGIFVCFALLLFAAHAFAAPVPDTGQTKCYNDKVEIPCPSSGQPFYGQDANYNINPISYTKLDGNGNDLPDSATSWVTVRDNVTGLIWEMKTNKDGVKNYNDPHDADNTYTWYDRNPATNGGYAGTPGNGTDTEDFIKALNDAKYGGYSDWRLPTTKELSYIVNYSFSSGSMIDTRYFPNTAANFYWSSTAYIGLKYGAFCGHFESGQVNGEYEYKDSMVYARAVRGGQSGSGVGSYTDNGDGTVTDTFTGLTWQQAGLSSETWEQALTYCEGLSLGGHTDWRLPTIKELLSMVDYSQIDPAINITYFPEMKSYFYWSSTTRASFPEEAWGVGFDTGSGGNFNEKYSKLGVRAVRGGQGGPTPTPTPTPGVCIDYQCKLQGGKCVNGVCVIPTPSPTACTATINGILLLHMPYLSYVNPVSGTLSLWAELLYEFNPTYPTLLPFKLTNAAFVNNPSFSCSASTLSSELNIHLPDVLLPDGSTHLWVNLEYDIALSANGNNYWVVTNYGPVSN